MFSTLGNICVINSGLGGKHLKVSTTGLFLKIIGNSFPVNKIGTTLFGSLIQSINLVCACGSEPSISSKIKHVFRSKSPRIND